MSKSDMLFIRNALDGDDHAYRILHDRHKRALVNFLIAYVDSPDDLDDCAQLAWIRAFASLNKYRSEATFATWLRRIGRNVALQSLRKRRRQTELRQAVVHGVASPGFDDEIIHKVDIERWLQDLPTRMKDVVGLILEGYTHRMIAARLGITEGTSKSQLHKALKRTV